jgi:tRNA C32,U32 (ribose-2'-O)-methylase TrmJ
VLIVAYELWQASEQAAPLPIRAAQPANAAQLEGLFDAAERALWGIEFFKTGSSAAVMRSLRGLIHRAELDAREAALLQAMALETLHFLRRKGIEIRAQNHEPDQIDLPPKS